MSDNANGKPEIEVSITGSDEPNGAGLFHVLDGNVQPVRIEISPDEADGSASVDIRTVRDKHAFSDPVHKGRILAADRDEPLTPAEARDFVDRHADDIRQIAAGFSQIEVDGDWRGRLTDTAADAFENIQFEWRALKSEHVFMTGDEAVEKIFRDNLEGLEDEAPDADAEGVVTALLDEARNTEIPLVVDRDDLRDAAERAVERRDEARAEAEAPTP